MTDYARNVMTPDWREADFGEKFPRLARSLEEVYAAVNRGQEGGDGVFGLITRVTDAESDIVTLETDLTAQITTLEATVTANYNELLTLIATNEGAIATLETSLTAQYDSLSATVTSNYNELISLTSTNESAIASLETTLTASIDDLDDDLDAVSASVTINATAIATLESQTATYWVETNASGNKAGMQIQSESGGSHIHQYGQKLSYGKDFATESVTHDPNAGVGGQTTYRAPDGTVTHRIDWNTGIIRSYNTSGVEWWNNVQGVIYDSLPDDVKTQIGEDDGDANITSVSDAWTTLATVDLGTVPGTGVISADGKINVLTNATTGAAVGGEYRVQYKLGAGAWTDLLDGDWQTNEVLIDDGGGGTQTRYTSYYGSYAGSKAAPGAGALQFRLQVFKPGSTGSFTSEGTMTAKRSP